jgi:hypothetical protein
LDAGKKQLDQALQLHCAIQQSSANPQAALDLLTGSRQTDAVICWSVIIVYKDRIICFAFCRVFDAASTPKCSFQLCLQFLEHGYFPLNVSIDVINHVNEGSRDDAIMGSAGGIPQIVRPLAGFWPTGAEKSCRCLQKGM